MTTEDKVTNVSPLPPVAVLGSGDVPPRDAEALLDGAVLADSGVAVVSFTGPAVIQCIQGILTNDIEARGPHGFVYGAVLTPKGMIITDLWVARSGGTVTVYAPPEGRQALFDVFTRSLPPRLARPVERTDTVTVLRLAGPGAADVARRAGLAVPEAGAARRGAVGGVECDVARPPQDQPFVLQLACTRDAHHAVRSALERAGAAPAPSATLELARILAGWPRLGAEIDQKTLPQEVRFDELEGVSYTKGCYTGQETVARLHFRGHANREVTGLLWDRPPASNHPEIRYDDKRVGRVSSIAWVERAHRYIGLGLVRTSVTRGEVVTASGAPARTVDLPFQLPA